MAIKEKIWIGHPEIFFVAFIGCFVGLFILITRISGWSILATFYRLSGSLSGSHPHKTLGSYPKRDRGLNILIERATISDAEEILALQKLAYRSEAEIYHDFNIPPLV